MDSGKISSMADFFRPVSARESFSGVREATGEISSPLKQGNSPSIEIQPQMGATGEEAGKQAVSQAVTSINDYFQRANRSLHFTLNETLGEMVVEIKDAETDELIRSIPPKEVIELAEHLEEMDGLFFKERA
ncbi:MAG: flagellar protein FlaG [Methylohalobius sp. ZOD2]